jgi:hypothetical protein
MNENIVLLECENFPCIAWYQLFLKYENIQIEQFEYFVRKSFRNRTVIAGPNGLVTLSIPLKGGRNQKNSMKDIEVSYDENWQAVHWKTIESCYRRSPYFEYYAEEIKMLFEKKHRFLMDYNLKCLQLVNQLLQVKKEFVLTEKYEKIPLANCIDARNIFEENRSFELPNYMQVFQDRIGFKSNLSILDMLFCEGKPLIENLKSKALFSQTNLL